MEEIHDHLKGKANGWVLGRSLSTWQDDTSTRIGHKRCPFASPSLYSSGQETAPTVLNLWGSEDSYPLWGKKGAAITTVSNILTEWSECHCSKHFPHSKSLLFTMILRDAECNCPHFTYGDLKTQSRDSKASSPSENKSVQIVYCLRWETALHFSL
jgi:hypothetical protein